MIKVHIMHTGAVKVDKAIPYGSKNPLAVTGIFRSKRKKLVLPVSAYLIEHPSGKVLIDTGWDSTLVYEKPKRFFGLLNGISTPILKKEDCIDYQLKQLNINPEQIDYVLFSHMDFDHTSGLRLVKNAKKIMAAKEEIEDSKKYFFRYVKNNWNFANIETFEYENTGVGPVGKSYDVFGDGKIVLVNTPGHTNGMFTAVISNDNKFIALAGDTIYSEKSLKENILPGFLVNKYMAKMSIQWLKKLSENNKCIKVIANHEPNINPQVIEL